MRKNSFLFETSPFKQLRNEFYLAVAAKHTTEDFFSLEIDQESFLNEFNLLDGFHKSSAK